MSPYLGYSHYHIMQAQRRALERQKAHPEDAAPPPEGLSPLGWALTALTILGAVAAIGLVVHFAT